MLKTSSPILCASVLAVLLPVFLLLPTLHAHSKHQHIHGYDTSHNHPAVVHADFFSLSAHEHDRHNEDHRGRTTQDESSKPSNLQIRFFTLLPRCFVLFTPLLERVPLAFFPIRAVITSLPLPLSGTPPSDYSPPVQLSSLPAISPRSPPYLV